MDLLNRVIIVVVILAVMILIPLVLIFPEQAQSTLQYMADVIGANLVWLASLSPGAQLGVRAALSVAGMVAFCIGLLLLALEVVRIRRSTVRLKDGSGEVVMNGVAGHLAYYVDLLPDVLRVKPSVQSTGKGVRAALYVDTAPGVNIPAKSSEVKQTARQVLEEQLGLRVKGDIRVVVRPVPYPRSRQGKRPPAIPQAPVSTPRPAPIESPPEPVIPEPAPAPKELDVLEETESNSELIDVKAPPPEQESG